MTKASEDTKGLLEAIQSYETFCRLLQDAFDDCLVRMSEKRGRVYPKELARTRGLPSREQEGLPEIFDEVADRVQLHGQLDRFLGSFSIFQQTLNPEEWVNQLFDHHIKIQRNKPPNGKNPWFERFDDSSFVIRPAYRRSKGGRHDDAYVHYYRTNPLLTFAEDLELVAK